MKEWDLFIPYKAFFTWIFFCEISSCVVANLSWHSLINFFFFVWVWKMSIARYCWALMSFWICLLLWHAYFECENFWWEKLQQDDIPEIAFVFVLPKCLVGKKDVEEWIFLKIKCNLADMCLWILSLVNRSLCLDTCFWISSWFLQKVRIPAVHAFASSCNKKLQGKQRELFLHFLVSFGGCSWVLQNTELY